MPLVLRSLVIALQLECLSAVEHSKYAVIHLKMSMWSADV